MKNKKIRILYTKLLILIICLLIICRIVTLVLAKYETASNSTANVGLAFYLLKEDYKKMTLNLDSVYPHDGVYVYNFSIGNQDNGKFSDIDLIYNLNIRTTTNLPLQYELYMNQEYTNPNSTTVIKNTIVEKDVHGTYFRTIKTDPVYLKFKEPKTNLYQLVVKFPLNYNNEDYQDVIEMIEINVESKQVTSQDQVKGL